jgi:signal transduction histidine kinase
MQLFDIEYEQFDTHPDATALFESYPVLASHLDTEDSLRTEIALTVDGVERDFDLNITSIEYERGNRGKVAVLRDITSLKQRERDLGLLKRVLTRVFRHNVRNDMTAIRGYAETIERHADDDVVDHAREILAQSDELIEQSEKTRLIAEVIDADDAVVTTDLAAAVTDAVTSYRTQYPAATITSSVPDAVPVRAHRNIGLAIEQLIENAIVHDGDPDVQISVDTGGERIGVVIEDTGPGIPESEIDALQQGEESELQHGSGVGLWLAKWIVEYSGGELALEHTDTGTRAVVWLQRGDRL